jgi:3-isopropylmalate dehydrogenase
MARMPSFSELLVIPDLTMIPKQKCALKWVCWQCDRNLGLYANIRPVSTFPSLLHKSPLAKELVEGADFVAIRELTGGIYFGKPQGRSEDGNTAYDTCVYHRFEVERIAQLAFDFAMRRRKKLCMVDKANVLATSRLMA